MKFFKTREEANAFAAMMSRSNETPIYRTFARTSEQDLYAENFGVDKALNHGWAEFVPTGDGWQDGDKALPAAFDVTISYSVSRQFLDDLLCCAMEGGCSYWGLWDADSSLKARMESPDGVRNGEGSANNDRYYYAYTGFSYEFTDADDHIDFKDQNKSYPSYRPLTLESLKDGFQLWLNGPWRNDFHGDVLDACCHDAETADTIVQLAVFGEVIFG